MNLRQIDIVKKYQPLVDVADSIQADALDWLLKELKMNRGTKVLDFGCGDGRHQKTIQRAGCEWFGVDLVSYPEVNKTKKAYSDRAVYDGHKLPFNRQSFDVVFSCQVLEHVQDLQTVFRELGRVCKTGGRFIGSTSHLEPYHSDSLRSITPYGLERVMDETGFQLEKIKAGVDCFSLIGDRIFPNLLPTALSNLMNRIIWSPKGSPLNRLIHLWGRIKKIDPKILECIKLQFSGHIVFQGTRV